MRFTFHYSLGQYFEPFQKVFHFRTHGNDWAAIHFGLLEINTDIIVWLKNRGLHRGNGYDWGADVGINPYLGTTERCAFLEITHEATAVEFKLAFL